MENAGKEDMLDTAERKGLGTPATRAGILEKLASTGFLERKKSKKTVQLMPSRDARSLITVLPEQLQSPLLTAEWEYRLGEIERGELSPEEFLSGIYAMLRELAATYQVVKGTEYLFSPPREAVGRCPRCGGEVTESQKGFFCQSETCRFAIWKDSKRDEYFTPSYAVYPIMKRLRPSSLITPLVTARPARGRDGKITLSCTAAINTSGRNFIKWRSRRTTANIRTRWPLPQTIFTGWAGASGPNCNITFWPNAFRSSM